ncbi:MAG: hypothetical protein O2807_00025 [bacterium]|nr:hypothetical protein [bacterium]
MTGKNYPVAAPEVAEVYRRLAGWTRKEIAGLKNDQLDRTGSGEWALWPVRYQLSHMSYITNRWFMVLYGATALPWRPVDMSQFGSFINTPKDDRRFSAERYGDPGWLLDRLEEACGAAAERADRMSEEDVQAPCLLFIFPEDARVGVTDEPTLDLWSRNARCHPDGVEADPDRPGHFLLSPLATLRHALWDDLIHLRSIRMHKEAMGLPPACPEAPEGGYAPAYPIR